MPEWTEIAAITATVQDYFDGLYDGDADKLARVFHPASSLTDLRAEGVKVVQRDEWLAIIRSRVSARTQGLPRHDHIEMIDQSGPATALTKVKCALVPRFFTDYLAMAKVDGRWQVIQKVYTTEVRG
jgi:hypothetical protein